MNVLQAVEPTWEELTHELGKVFAKRAAQTDLQGKFVFANYEELKTHRYFSAMVPLEFGGGGMSYEEMCNLIRTMAHYCGSTALAFSMHQHLVAATVWKYKNKGEGAAVLQKIADQQLVLVSTGARDWLGSNGELERVEGGYLFSGKKAFASQSIAGDIAVTSAPYLNEDQEWKVLHFSTPIKTKGVQVLDDWDVMGMRATGSQTIQFDRVFIPDSAIALTRDQGEFHLVWNVVLAVAMPLIMSAYVGIAEKAMEIALSIGKKYYRNQDHMPYLIGKLNNTLVGTQAQWAAMYALTNNFNFKPQEAMSMQILSLKTNVADGCIKVVSDAMEAIGGQSFYRKNTLERLFRDVQAAQFHPLPKWDQYAFTGKRLLEK
ncbi:acyl-CoA dehydrogenase family protein [Flavilitoribacter nigricans]|uniref:Acyl-CoA dehydrogenase n=1 Tax=Flavilitoribacter nigricans (strain ATCC 23147 / DSM 23189 / NBRC 102662 / NCIMB 1420 / SS-2) TaxID=1122177 RepID=A0A2D0NJJ1_FLAN2|nr:acyl-CoA dehydrogenase family protein [Flavilitoribacter nigricans]PHN07903.1 acyl-CoA dehydrogenase [Flavilitoribacter nigricans DSM 23189 = NBRC 102662]